MQVQPDKEFLAQITTKFHPLNKHYVENVIEDQVILRDRVKIMTYNMMLVPEVYKAFFEGPFKKQRIQDFINKHIAAYDVVCMQECFGFMQETKAYLI